MGALARRSRGAAAVLALGLSSEGKGTGVLPTPAVLLLRLGSRWLRTDVCTWLHGTSRVNALFVFPKGFV